MARCLALLLALAAIGCTAGAAGAAISLQDVIVSLLEASGAVVSQKAVAGPGAGVQVALDHTRTLKVRSRSAEMLGSTKRAAELRPSRCRPPAPPVVCLLAFPVLSRAPVSSSFSHS